MKARFSIRPGRNQRGFGMIAVLSLIVLLSAYLVASALTQTNTQLANTREERSMEALRQAKAALIAYAASEQWQSYKSQTTDQPGALPCPSRKHVTGEEDEDGESEGALCTNTAYRIGRLPWRTLGIADLKDSSGESLWYAVSSNFYKHSSNVINSDTQGLLTVTGSSPASNVVAIVFAPGQALTGQNRDPSSETALNSVSAYLEGYTAGASDYSFQSIALPSDTANDRMLVLTQSELMAAVEPVVAARIERDIKPYLTSYFTQWGAHPFPAKFNDTGNVGPGSSATRAQSAYSGDTTQTSGLLPLTANPAYAWTSGSGAVTLTGGTAGSISDVDCTESSTAWQCNFRIRSINLGANPDNWGPCTDGSNVKWRYCVINPSFSVSAQLGDGPALSFAVLPVFDANNPSDTTKVKVTTQGSGSVARSMSSGTVSGAFSSVSGNIIATVTFQGTHSYSRFDDDSFNRFMRVTIPKPTVSSISSSADDNAGWFIANQWYRQTYYALSPGYLPAAGAACTSDCLTVKNLPSGTTTNSGAVLLFSGRSLDGSTRPSSALSSYLEGDNLTTAQGTTTRLFEHRQGVATSINDRAVVVTP